MQFPLRPLLTFFLETSGRGCVPQVDLLSILKVGRNGLIRLKSCKQRTLYTPRCVLVFLVLVFWVFFSCVYGIVIVRLYNVQLKGIYILIYMVYGCLCIGERCASVCDT